MARKLRVVSISDEMTSRDDRRFRTIGVIPVPEEGEPISTHGIHKRNIWNKAPLDGDEIPYYHAIERGSIIMGDIVTLPTKRYWIENDRGKWIGEDGTRYNEANFKTYVPFEDETAEQMRNNDGLAPNQSYVESKNRNNAYLLDEDVMPLKLVSQGDEAFEQEEPFEQEE